MYASQVELRISCSNLPDKDVFSKSDPCVYLLKYETDFETGTTRPIPVLLCKTEVIQDNLNPVFTKPLLADYHFEEEQKLRLVVVDIDDPNGDMDKQDFLGSLDFTLGNLLTSPQQTFTKPLVNKEQQRGTITVTAEEVLDCKQLLKVTFRAQLPKRGMLGLGKPHAFLEIFRLREDGQRVGVYRGVRGKQATCEPLLDPVKLSMQEICNGDRDRALLFQVTHWKSNGAHKPIGAFQATVNELVSGRKDFDLNKPNVAAGTPAQKIGTLSCLQCSLEQQVTFLDYIRQGCQIQLQVAIDFTVSNGHPSLPESLHYRGGTSRGYLNDYERAILSVGRILEEYDADKMFPVYGFGGKLPSGAVSHCWPLNANPEQPECHGLENLLQLYRLARDQIQLAAPTNFSPTILHVLGQVAAQWEQTRKIGSHFYTVLFMITDGIITDMDSTIRAIIRASRLPMSILIVGVGNADFTAMNVLDSDDQVLQMDGEQMVRDIVQFVPLRDFSQSHRQAPTEPSPLLARHVLAELPDQIVQFFTSQGLRPTDT